MSEFNEIFIDGVGRIGLYAGAVRCELVSIEPKEQEKKPDIHNRINLVMSPQGFLQVVGSLQTFVTQLEEKGVIVKRAEEKGAKKEQTEKEK